MSIFDRHKEENKSLDNKNNILLINRYTLKLKGQLDEQYKNRMLILIQKTYIQTTWLLQFALILLLTHTIIDDHGNISIGILIGCNGLLLASFVLSRKHPILIPYTMLILQIVFNIFSYFYVEESKNYTVQCIVSSNRQNQQTELEKKQIFDESSISFTAILVFLILMIFIKLQYNFICLAIGYIFTLIIVIVTIQKNVFQILVLSSTAAIVFFFIYIQERNKRLQYLDLQKQSQDLLGWKNLLNSQLPSQVFVISQNQDVTTSDSEYKKTASYSLQQQLSSQLYLKNCKVSFANQVCLREFNIQIKEEMINILDKIQIKFRKGLDSHGSVYDSAAGNALIQQLHSKDYLEKIKAYNNVYQSSCAIHKKEEEEAAELEINPTYEQQECQGKDQIQNDLSLDVKIGKDLTQKQIMLMQNKNTKQQQQKFNLSKLPFESARDKIKNMSVASDQIIPIQEKFTHVKCNESLNIVSQGTIRSRNITNGGLVIDEFQQQYGTNLSSLGEIISSIFQKKNLKQQLSQSKINSSNFKIQAKTNQYKLQFDQMLKQKNVQNFKNTKNSRLKGQNSLHLIEDDGEIQGFSAKEIIHFQNCKYLIPQINSNIKQNSPNLEAYKFYDIKILECQWDHQDSVMIVMNDVSPQIIYQRQLEINEYKEKIISSVTHNLRTPLNGILTFLCKENYFLFLDKFIFESIKLSQFTLCFLKKETAQDQIEVKETKNLINLSSSLGKQQLLLINDLIDYSQMIKGELHLEIKQDTLENLVNEVTSIFQDQIDSKKMINFSIIYEANKNEKVITDIQRLQQILANVLQNSIKFTFSGKILLKIQKTNKNLITFTINDTGTGIEKDLQMRIQNMQNLEQTDFQHGKLFKINSIYQNNLFYYSKIGIGLGLTISKMILQYLGPDNRFQLESQVGKGTKVKFSIYQNLNENIKTALYDLYPIQDEDSPAKVSQGQNLIQVSEKKIQIQKELSDIPDQSEVQNPYCNQITKDKVHLDKQVEITISDLLANKNIMIVDDTPFNIKALRCIFRDVPNLEISEAFNGQECIDLLLKDVNKKYDLILMDVNMPVLDGLTATSMINNMIFNNQIYQIPIIIVTAYDMPINRQYSKSVGAKAHVSKPVQKKYLIDALKQVFLNPYFLSQQ